MLKINKKGPIPEFSDLMKSDKCPNVWDDIPSDIKKKMREFILFNEQNSLCGYTELPLSSTYSHIDHFKKRSMFPQLTFDWNNFVVASLDEDFGAKYKDNHSNLTKDVYTVIYNPIVNGMDSVVFYGEDGRMYPNSKNDNSVIRTIEIFNLNNVKLMERRKEIIRQVNSYYEGCCTIDDIRECLKDCGFPSVVECELGRLQSLKHKP